MNVHHLNNGFPRNTRMTLSVLCTISQETNRLEYLIPKKSSLRHRLPMGDQGFIDFVSHLLEVNPKKRPSAAEALKDPWLQYPYEPISSWWRNAWWFQECTIGFWWRTHEFFQGGIMPPDSDLDIDWTVISMWLPSWKVWLVIEGEQTTEIYVSVGILSMFSSLFFIFFFFFFLLYWR